MDGRFIHLYSSAAVLTVVAGAVGSFDMGGRDRGKTTKELDPKCIVHH